MKAIILLLVFNCILHSNTMAQCVVSGKITDYNGEIPIGAVVSLKSNSTVGTITDLDGNYILKINEAKPQILVISYLGYNTIEDSVECITGEKSINNYILETTTTELDEVTVVAKSRKSTDVQLEAIKRKSSNTIDFISAETIKKTGDVNVASAIARVTGVSTNSGGLVTVRGAGDRYIKTTINGSRIPTLDPFSNNIKLDLFPSSLVDNITITKTARPDLAGDWAGAYISIDTKEYPEKFSVDGETSFGYNAQTSFDEILSTEHSATDWLGYDNGLRAHDHDQFVPFSQKPTTYQEFEVLGLSNFLKDQGITQSTAWTDEYTRMGLVELGLLGKAQINDEIAYANALAEYNTKYQADAYALINADAIKSAKSFPNNWNASKRKAPLNFSQSLSIGSQILLFGKPLGYIMGFRYSSTFQYDPTSTANKVINEGLSENHIEHNDSIFQEAAKETNGWSGLINIAYKINSNNSFSALFMPNIIGVNNIRSAFIFPGNTVDSSITPEYRIKTTGNTIQQFYESRKQLVYQFKSEHYLPVSKTKIECNISYTNGTSNAPDFKMAQFAPADDSIQNIPVYVLNAMGAGRIYRYLTQNIFDSRISAEIPLGNDPALVRKIKFGAAYQSEYRVRDQYYYQVWPGDGVNFSFNAIHKAHPEADPYGLDRFDIDSVYHFVQQFYTLHDVPSNHVFGESTIKAGFLMFDYSVIPAIRFSGGLRVEQSYMYTDGILFENHELSSTDERRRFQAGPGIGIIFMKPGEIKEINYLPSANIIVKLKHDETAPINLRFNYSQTIARPNLQELSDIRYYDFEQRDLVSGNSDLKIVEIKNYDFRFEAYFHSGDNLSFSVFYKDIKNHIDVVNQGALFGYVYANSLEKSWIKGIELEGKKQLTRVLEFRANLTLVSSRSKPSIPYIDIDGNRTIVADTAGKSYTLLGQAPYVINSMLSYTSKKGGLMASINYNIQGPRLVIIGAYSFPDIYELPKHMVDFKIMKSIGKHFNASLKITDVLASVKFWKFKELNTDVVRAYKMGDEYPLDYDRYTWGTYFVFALAYKF